MQANRATLVLLLAGVVQLIAWCWIRSLGDLSQQVHALWVALLPILCGYGAALWLGLRPASTRWTMPIIGVVAVGSRLLLLDTAPSLSDDIYRYVWDGRVQLAGHNPYGQAPDDPALSALRDDDWTKINHPEVVTVYPPVAQWWFAAGQWLSAGVLSMKVSLLLCDLLLLVVLWRWLTVRGQDPARLAIYAWHPLPVLEIAGNGHVDILAICCMFAGLLWLESRRRHLAALALAAAVLGKLLPVLALGAVWRRLHTGGSSLLHRLNPRGRLTLLWVPLLVVAAYLPFLDAGSTMWSGLSTYAGKWRFNDSAFELIYSLLANPLPGWEWDDEALRTARWVCAAAVGLLAAWTAVRTRDELVGSCSAVFGAQLLLAPTVHPWYVLWLLPFLVLQMNPAWLAFSWSVLLSYHVLVDFHALGVWHELSLIRWLEYGPVYGLLLAEAGAFVWKLRNGPDTASSDRR